MAWLASNKPHEVSCVLFLHRFLVLFFSIEAVQLKMYFVSVLIHMYTVYGHFLMLLLSDIFTS